MLALLSNRLVQGGLALLAVLALVWYYGHTRYNAGERACQAAQQAALEAQAADLKRRMDEATQAYDAALAPVYVARDAALAELERLRGQSPRTLTRTVEVPGACPTVGLSSDFWLRWNAEAAAASQQPVPPP